MSSKECTKINHEWFFQKEKEALQNGAGGHFEESRAGSSRKAKNKKNTKKNTRHRVILCLLFTFLPAPSSSRLTSAGCGRLSDYSPLFAVQFIVSSSPSYSSSPLRRLVRASRSPSNPLRPLPDLVRFRVHLDLTSRSDDRTSTIQNQLHPRKPSKTQ